MPSTRRRLLLGAAGTLAALAGCNETSGDDPPTVTPVDVPKTKAEALQEAANIEAPKIPPAVRVTDAHLEAAIEDAEILVADLEAVAARADDVDLRGLQRRIADEPRDVVERAETELQSARETGPSEKALSTVRNVVREVGLALGYIETKLGELDRERIETELQEEEAATEAFRDRFSYQIARPLGASLPTFRAAETTRPDPSDIGQAREPLVNLDDGRVDEATAFGLARRELETHRRKRQDAARYLEVATDENAPSMRQSIEGAITDLRSEVEEIAETYGDQDPPDDASLEGEIQNIRVHVGRRSRRWLSRIEEHDGTQSLDLLLDVAEWLVEFSSLDAAVGRTTDVIDGGEVASEAVVAAKRDAVVGLEAAVDGNPLQRSLAERSGLLLQTADRNATARDDARTVARTHLLYSAVDEWCERSLERADAVTASLQAQQS